MLRERLSELQQAVEDILYKRISLYGVNPKTGSNTLMNSNLENSIKITQNENDATVSVALQIVDYWEFISRGWKKTGNYPGTMSKFVANITDWVRRKNIRFEGKTENQTVWLIINNIMKNGLKARPFMVYNKEGDITQMLPELAAYIDKWFDSLFEDIINDVNIYFKK